jgi:hypothetical protein
MIAVFFRLLIETWHITPSRQLRIWHARQDRARAAGEVAGVRHFLKVLGPRQYDGEMYSRHTARRNRG